MTDSWIALATVVLAILAALFGFTKWMMDWAEKRDADQEAAFNARIESHKEEFDIVHKRIDTHDSELSETREELIRDYMKRQDFKSWRDELREDFNNVYQKLGGIDRAVNQLIGQLKGKTNNE